MANLQRSIVLTMLHHVQGLVREHISSSVRGTSIIWHLATLLVVVKNQSSAAIRIRSQNLQQNYNYSTRQGKKRGEKKTQLANRISSDITKKIHIRAEAVISATRKRFEYLFTWVTWFFWRFEDWGEQKVLEIKPQGIWENEGDARVDAR